MRLDKKTTSFMAASKEGQILKDTIAELDVELSSQMQRSCELSTLIQCNSELIAELATIREQLTQVEALGELPTDESQIAALEAEVARVQNKMKNISQNLSDKSVLGMTLDSFIGLTMNPSLRFDHVIADEAGYAPLAKVIPLCSLHCPISLLGDHCQLPPVYEGEKHPESECYWGTSALYLEDAFEPEIGTSFTALLERSRRPPRFENLHRTKLKQSYRFGVTLAALLDRHFYDIGLCSRSNKPTRIQVIDCPPVAVPRRQKRENHAECNAIVASVGDWLSRDDEAEVSLAVLSPYRNQVKLLRDTLWNRFGRHPDFDLVDVLTVNQAQGREWDAVIFSASDTTSLTENDPYFSDTSKTEGRLLVNTAISRAKKRLEIFCDTEAWARRHFPESFLSEVSMNPEFRL